MTPRDMFVNLKKAIFVLNCLQTKNALDWECFFGDYILQCQEELKMIVLSKLINLPKKLPFKQRIFHHSDSTRAVGDGRMLEHD